VARADAELDLIRAMPKGVSSSRLAFPATWHHIGSHMAGAIMPRAAAHRAWQVDAPVATDVVAIKALTRVFQAWKLGGERSAKLIGVSERTWARMQAGTWAGALSQDQTLRASALVGLYKGLHLYFGADLADAWVSLPNRGPLFRGSVPVDLMVAGGLPSIGDVRDYVDAIRGGL
jgi:uncharacterized protein (DUF2384 family)